MPPAESRRQKRWWPDVVAGHTRSGHRGIMSDNSRGVLPRFPGLGELLTVHAHDDVIDPAAFLEGSPPEPGLFDEPTLDVHGERSVVVGERPELHLLEVEPVEGEGEHGHHGVAGIPLPPEGRLTDEHVHGADPVAPPELIEPDPPDRTISDQDRERPPFDAAALDVGPDVFQRGGQLVVHVPPNLGVVHPLLDQGVVALQDRAEPDHATSDHRDLVSRPTSSRYTLRTSSAVASHENRVAWRCAPADSRVARPGSARIRRMRAA